MITLLPINKVNKNEVKIKMVLSFCDVPTIVIIKNGSSVVTVLTWIDSVSILFFNNNLTLICDKYHFSPTLKFLLVIYIIKDTDAMNKIGSNHEYVTSPFNKEKGNAVGIK